MAAHFQPLALQCRTRHPTEHMLTDSTRQLSRHSKPASDKPKHIFRLSMFSPYPVVWGSLRVKSDLFKCKGTKCAPSCSPVWHLCAFKFNLNKIFSLKIEDLRAVAGDYDDNVCFLFFFC